MRADCLEGQWSKNTAGREHWRLGGHAAADQVPLCWCLDCNLYIHMQLTICIGLLTCAEPQLVFGMSRKTSAQKF